MSATGIIPVDPTVGWYSMRTTLGLSIYVLTFTYNTRMGLWILDIADANQTPIVTGIPTVTGRDLLSPWKGTLEGLPSGYLFVVDQSGNSGDPTQANFGSTCILVYWEP